MKNLNKMKIAGDMQFEIGQDKVSHFPDLSVKDDVTLHKKLSDMKHSTFDLSKFTVVGTPNITDDGVASGFSSSNYLKLPTNLGSLIHNANTWKTFAKFTYNTNTDWATLFSCNGHKGISIGFVPSQTNRLYVALSSDGTNEDIADNQPLSISGLVPNEIYTSILTFTGTTYTLEVYNSNNEIVDSKKQITSSNKVVANDYYTIGGRYAFGSIDLKHFSITVDGKEVFSGNKTGLDVIKPDNYTVVGSPVISDDGVASGFSNSNYIQKFSILPTEVGHNYIFKTRYKHITNNFSATGYMFNIITTTGNYFGAIARMKTKTISFVNSMTGGPSFLDLVSLVEGKTYDIEYHTDFSTYVKYYVDGDLKQSLTYSATEGYPTTGNVLIGVTLGAGLPLTMGSVDLNSFKIYVDGNIVYQPCLKIPYTQSKTGSKIVDGVYRDRVIDLYEQEGQAHYYTIGENDFTLATCKGSDVIAQGEAEGITYTKTADLTLTQRGNCTSGSVVNLLPYKDENSYHVSAPYTAKTSNSFTPSADGDFIAVGKCYL